MGINKSEYCQIQFTAVSRVTCLEIADYLLANSLASCVQIIDPITSIYKWKGQTHKEQEVLCILKTTTELFDKVEKEIKRLHPYEVPEIIAMPILKGNRDYLNWIKKNTKKSLKK